MGHFSLKSEVKHKKIAKELEMILDNIPGPVFYKGTKNNFIKVNKYMADAHGVKKEKLEGKSLFDLYPKDQAQAYWDDDLDVIKSGKPKLNIEEPWETEEGIRWVNTNKIPYIDKNGEIKGIIGFSLDITEHKKEEGKRQESEENFRALTENANDGILIIDGKGEFIYVNRRMSEITGYNIEELLKFKIKDLTHPDEYNKIYERFRRRLEGKSVPNQYESVIVNKKGRNVQVEVTAAKTIWKNQPADLVIFRDITTRKKSEKELIKHRKHLEELVEERTERLKMINEQLKREITEHKKVELALKESEELYKSLVRTSPDAIIVSDLKGKVIEVSKRALELSGFEFIEDIIGKSSFDFIAPEDHEKAAKGLQKAFKNGILENAEYKILRKDGTYYIGELNTSLIKDIYGKPKSFLAIIRDTTEKKKMEKALKESEEWLSTTLRSIGDAVIAFDTKSNVTFLNPVAESLTGWKQEEAIEKPLEEIFNIINEETRKPVEDPVSRVLREGRIIGLANHTILITKNGKEIPIADSGAPIMDEEGKIIGIVLIFRDITERKKAEKEISALAKFPSENPNPVLRVIKEKVIYVNNAGEIVFNTGVGDLVPESLNNTVKKAFSTNKIQFQELKLANQIYSFVITPIKEEGYVNIYGRNITERRKAEEKLHASEEKFRVITETSIDSIYSLGKNGIILYMNSAGAKMYGYKPEEIIGMNFTSLIEKKRLPEGLELVKKVLAGQNIRGEIYVKHKKGYEFPIYFSMVPVKENDDIVGFAGFSRDITERKKAEEILRISEEALTAFMESATEGFVIYDKELNLLEINNPGLRVLGMSKENMIGKNILEISPGLEKTGRYDEYLKVLKTGEPFHIDELVPHPRFGDIHLLVSAFKVGEGLGIIISDITKRKKVELALKESEEWLSTTLRSIGDAVIAIDTKSNVTFLNPVAEALTGWKQEEAIEKPLEEIFNIINEKTRKAVENPISRVLREGRIIGLANHTILITKNGNEIPIADSGAPIKDDKGKIIGVVLIFRDITERRKAEREIIDLARFPSENPNPVLRVTTEKVIYANKAGQNVFNVNIGDIVHVIINESVIESIDSNLPKTTEISFEDRTYLIDVTPIEEEGYANVYGRDITERKKAEEELIKYHKHLEELVEERTERLTVTNEQLKQEITVRKKAEERFSNFKKLAPDAFFLYDSEFNLVDINDAGLELLPGMFTKEEVIGKDITELFPNIKETDRYEKYEEVLKTGKLFSREEIEVHPKFGDIYLSTRAFKVGNDLGIIHSDITVRKKAEQEALRQKTILEAINKVFQKAITCENEEEIARTWLEVAQELSGAKFGFFGEVNQEGKFDTLAISNPGWDECKMPESQATRIIKGMEIRGMQFLPLIDGKSRIFNDPSHHPDSVGTPEGHPKITCLLAVPFKHKGKIIGEIGLGNKEEGFDEYDKKAIEMLSVAIVEALMKKRVEEKIKKSEENLRVSNENLKKILEELKRSNKELEQFAYVASHDLQEPLRMVASFTQLLQNRYQDKLDDDANDFINYAVDGANRMQTLISDLLTFSRVGTRGKPFIKIDMKVVLENIIANFRQLIEETNAIITNTPLPVIIADETQMMQLLQNLISNAIKFRGEEPPRIQVSGEVKIDKWVFSVHDNGIGIDSKYFDRIFIIFQRLHKKDEYGGTGIGLAVCKKIIQRHGGEIWVESELGKGSTFYFSIQKEKVGLKL